MTTGLRLVIIAVKLILEEIKRLPPKGDYRAGANDL